MLSNQELRQLQEKEMHDELGRTQRELIKARMDHAGGSLKETHRLQQLKRYVARMKTMMKEDMMEAAAKVSAAVKKPVETAKKKSK